MRDVDVVIENGTVAWIGSTGTSQATDEVLEAAGRCVVPGFVDSHTHLVFAGDRVEEFTARMAGRRYDAGGIFATVAATRSASLIELTDVATRLKREAEAQGTTTLETKSGYGLTVSDESRCLEVAEAISEEVTFLGAHVVAPEFRGKEQEYVALVTGPMLDACAPKARWCDVFCERGAFGPDAAREILHAGLAHGLGLRVHANQLSHGPGVQLAVEMGAASADHCTHLDAADVDALAGSDTVATLLPGAEFSTRSPYPDARRLLEAGVSVALATDCNPGTSYTTSMPFVIALAVQGDEDDAGRGAVRRHRRAAHALFDVTTSARSLQGFAATWSCWTRRLPPISPIGPGSTSSRPSSAQADFWVSSDSR